MNRTWHFLFCSLVCTTLGCGDSVKTAKPNKPITQATDEEWSQLLLGSWDGILVKGNGKKATSMNGIFNLSDGGKLTFDSGSEFKQFIGYGSWKVTDAQLQLTIESSNGGKMIPSGTTATFKLREISEKEFLYIDTTDQRTYSAKRVK